jgi:hypothetical protein
LKLWVNILRRCSFSAEELDDHSLLIVHSNWENAQRPWQPGRTCHSSICRNTMRPTFGKSDESCLTDLAASWIGPDSRWSGPRRLLIDPYVIA